jgi:hypothetical protein
VIENDGILTNKYFLCFHSKLAAFHLKNLPKSIKIHISLL